MGRFVDCNDLFDANEDSRTNCAFIENLVVFVLLVSCVLSVARSVGPIRCFSEIRV